MITFTKKNEAYDSLIQTLIRDIGNEQDREERANLLRQLDALVKNRKSLIPTIDANTIFQGAISVASILLIINYEHMNVLTSKALSFVKKS